MRVFLFRSISALALCSSLFSLLSCGHDQTLESISVTPQNVSISGYVPVHYYATGHYIHPPENKDLTLQVIWKSTTPNIIDFSDPTQPNVAIPTLQGCGTNIQLLAVVYGNPTNPTHGKVVTASTTINVAEPQIGPPCGP